MMLPEQTNVLAGLNDVKLIAGGGDFSLAVQFSTTVSYPVNVPQDLLLIYNTNSLDSSNVCAYYLANRPRVSNANVLGIGFSGFYVTNATVFTSSGFYVTNATNFETISPNNFTNQIVNPIINWLTLNPTKRPQYVILFLDVPSRVHELATNAISSPFYEGSSDQWPSVSYQLSSFVSSWSPFVMHINMFGTNDCMAYINKLASLGTLISRNSPILSASAGGYNNITYCLDDGGAGFGTPSYSTVQTLTNEGVALTNIYYGPPDTSTIIITNATNVVAYWSKGTHGHLAPYTFPLDTQMVFYGSSSWYQMTTLESYNGRRYFYDQYQSSFLMWFYPNAFGGTNYSNTPIGCISHVDEPFGAPNLQIYYGLWALGKNFAISAWNAGLTSEIQTVGDPFVTK